MGNIKNISHTIHLKRLEKYMIDVLRDSFLMEHMDEKTKVGIKTKISSMLEEFIDNYVEDYFNVNINIENNNAVIVPQNFVTALWLKGIRIEEDLEKVMESGYYSDSIASYTWDEEEKSMNVKPLTSGDNLF